VFDIHLAQQVVNGLSIGLVYALIAIGFTLIFGVLNVVNFAHGEVYTIGAFGGLFLITAFAPPLVAVLLGVMVIGVAYNLMLLIGLPTPAQMFVKGAILILAVAIDAMANRR